MGEILKRHGGFTVRWDEGGPSAGGYHASSNKPALRALYDNLGRDETIALRVDQAVRTSMQDGWHDDKLKATS